MYCPDFYLRSEEERHTPEKLFLSLFNYLSQDITNPFVLGELGVAVGNGGEVWSNKVYMLILEFQAGLLFVLN